MTFIAKLLITVTLFVPSFVLAQAAPSEPVSLRFSLHNQNSPEIDLVKGLKDIYGRKFMAFDVDVTLERQESNVMRFQLVKPLTIPLAQDGREFTFILRYLDLKMSPTQIETLSKIISTRHHILYHTDSSETQIPLAQVIEAQNSKTSIMSILQSGSIPKLQTFTNSISTPYFEIKNLLNNEPHEQSITVSFYGVRRYDAGRNVLVIDNTSTTSIPLENLSDSRVTRHETNSPKTAAILGGIQKLKQLSDDVFGHVEFGNGVVAFYAPKTGNVISINKSSCRDSLTKLEGRAD